MVEGWHNALQACFRCKHPALEPFVTGLKKDIGIHKLVLANVRTGKVEPQKPKYKKLGLRLSQICKIYDMEQDKIKYLQRIAHLQ